MFSFERVGYEPEIYIEDYAINYSNNGDSFIINDYYDEEGYDQAIIPVISINRNCYTVELYNFAYDEALPSDKPKILKAIHQLVALKDILNINNYLVVGEGANLYRQMYSTSFIK